MSRFEEQRCRSSPSTDLITPPFLCTLHLRFMADHSSSKTALFICTGNICRSPMAEGLFRQLLKEREDIRVVSAGVNAMYGQPASIHTVEVLRRLGVDLTEFRSQPLTEDLVADATWIFVMTRSHLDTIHLLFPEAADKAFLVCEFDPALSAKILDIPDPIGLGIDAYERTRDILNRALPSVLKFVNQHPDSMITKSAATSKQLSSNRSLAEVDPQIADAIRHEGRRQFENIELIASENFTSRAVMEAQGSCLTNKYSEGYRDAAGTVDASTWTSSSNWPSTAPGSSSPRSMSMCRPTPAARPIWPSISQCFSPATAF